MKGEYLICIKCHKKKAEGDFPPSPFGKRNPKTCVCKECLGEQKPVKKEHKKLCPNSRCPYPFQSREYMSWVASFPKKNRTAKYPLIKYYSMFNRYGKDHSIFYAIPKEHLLLEPRIYKIPYSIHRGNDRKSITTESPIKRTYHSGDEVMRDWNMVLKKNYLEQEAKKERKKNAPDRITDVIRIKL